MLVATPSLNICRISAGAASPGTTHVPRQRRNDERLNAELLKFLRYALRYQSDLGQCQCGLPEGPTSVAPMGISLQKEVMPMYDSDLPFSIA